ncbi:outer dense fiber protein 2 isoform X2 [Ornithorhynchus anatinus]|uniref:outer dense fiber protein 2 isoform X2 n=1 Tax=Ornithorhynchus anatinus TaxID=9258 RepID=UPI0019D4E8EF|nr:outer dense fiber protein 2 isoform X2 [Ornithorhynchus anatinus]
MGEARAASRKRRQDRPGWGSGLPPTPIPTFLPTPSSSFSPWRLHGTASHLNHFLRRRLWAQPCRCWFPPCRKNEIKTTTTQKKVLQSSGGTHRITVTKAHKRGMKGDTVNVRRSVRVKTKAPWVPPGKGSCRDASYKWEGPTHRLEITPPSSEKLFSVLRLSDLSTDEDESNGQSKINRYEKKIDSLMNAVGSLKSEVKMQKRQDQHCLAKRLLEERKEELQDVAHELAETEHENKVLRRNIERMKEEKDYTVLQKKHLQQEKDCLMSKLVEAEMDGVAAAKQVVALKDAIGKLKSEKNMTSSDINTLTRQKELLLQKLSTFEETNRTLRDLLKEQHGKERDSEKLMEQHGELLKRLKDADTEKVFLTKLLKEKEKEVDSLLQEVESEKNLERSGAQHKAEVEAIMEQLKDLKQKGERDKEALKKAIRMQKERAERSEEYAEQLHVQLADKDVYVAEALSTLEMWRNRYNQVVKDKGDLELEIIVLNDRVSDLVSQQNSLEEKMREDRETLVERLHRQTAEYAAFKIENERLKANILPVEDRLNQAQIEVQQLKASVRNYEGMIDSYKNQVVKTRLEADEVAAQLERCDKENKTLKDEMNKEIETARNEFQDQLMELQGLPEILKITETKLAECQDQLQSYEKKNVDLSTIINDLRSRMDHQGSKLEVARERHQSSQEENKQLSLKVEELERKLDATNAQNIEFLQVIAKREESIHQSQLRLEEKTRECSSLARQLEAAIEDARRQVEQTRERAVSRERTSQTKILDLETHLSRTKTELNQLRRSRDDVDRRYQSRLQDLKDRLEQSESTNRSMQNYVQFLKSSYANVFGDSALTSSPIRSRSPPA